MARILIIGGTGHVGGAVLDLVHRKHPDVPIKVQVRSEEKAARLVAKYPRVQTVVASLEDLAVLEAEAQQADIVIYAAPDITHDECIKALLRGLTAANCRTGYYIQTSGASRIYEEYVPGKEPRLWDDIEDIEDLLNMDTTKTHAATDTLVLNASPNVNVAVIAPPGIDGISPSIEHPLPLAVPSFVLAHRAFNSGFEVNNGLNHFTIVAVTDLARAYLILIEDALEGLGSTTDSPAEPAGFPLWGPKAFYFVDGESMPFHEHISRITAVLYKLGVIPSTEVSNVTQQDLVRTIISGGKEYDPDAPLPPADSWVLHLGVGFSSHMRVRGSRMRRLGWRPEDTYLDTLEDVYVAYLRKEKEQQSSS